MKEGKKVLSIQTDIEVINMLKEISAKEKRSQAKTIEVLIEEKFKSLTNVRIELSESCVNNFEKPEYCSHRNNHLCQKCKDW